MAQSRIIGYDIIRVIAASMVVAIHSNVFYLQSKDGSCVWFTAMELTALCAVSVPLFFMVSGAVNIGAEKPITLTDLYRRKLPKLMIPFLLWSCIYVIVRMGMGKIPVSADGFISLLWEPAYYQFWFIYSLIGMYICIPIFQFLIQKADKRTLQYTVVLWLFFSVVLPTALRYIPGFKISDHFNLVFLEGYWGYFFLGAYLKKYPIERPKRIGAIFAIVGVFITGVCAGIEYYCSTPYYAYVYCAYLLPGVVLAAVGLFLLISNITISGRKKGVIVWFSSLSMGVYYVHTLILSALDIFFKNWGYGIHLMLLKWVIACLISILVCYSLSIFKLFKKTLL